MVLHRFMNIPLNNQWNVLFSNNNKAVWKQSCKIPLFWFQNHVNTTSADFWPWTLSTLYFYHKKNISLQKIFSFLDVVLHSKPTHWYFFLFLLSIWFLKIHTKNDIRTVMCLAQWKRKNHQTKYNRKKIFLRFFSPSIFLYIHKRYKRLVKKDKKIDWNLRQK